MSTTETEITDDTPREDVDAIVKGVMKQKELNGGTEAADGQDTSKQTESTQAEVGDEQSAAESVEDDAAADQEEVGGEDSVKKDKEGSQKQEQGWLTDDVRSELPRWISDEDLSEFSSRDEFDRALALMDRAALRAGREAGKQGGSEESQGAEPTGERKQEHSQDGKFRKRQEEDGKGKDSESKPFEIDLDLSEFDEDLGEKVKDAFTGLRDHYEARLQSLDERFDAIEAEGRTREAAVAATQFDAIVDSLGYAGLFGKAGEESEKELEARRTLFNGVEAYSAGLAKFGREAPVNKAFVGRVVRMEFAEFVSKQDHKNLTKRITRQSNMRMGVGAERPAEQEYKGPLKKHPDVRRAYKELREAEDGD